jgi:Domain of unknown function (DUF2019)
MTRKNASEMTVEELVDRFISIALGQSSAINNDDNSKYNRLFDEMVLLQVELKQREGDRRRLLLPLLQHANAQVRLKAAFATLAVDRVAALAALQKISDQNEYPEAADARGIMESLAEGRYQPT